MAQPDEDREMTDAAPGAEADGNADGEFVREKQRLRLVGEGRSGLGQMMDGSNMLYSYQAQRRRQRRSPSKKRTTRLGTHSGI